MKPPCPAAVSCTSLELHKSIRLHDLGLLISMMTPSTRVSKIGPWCPDTIRTTCVLSLVYSGLYCIACGRWDTMGYPCSDHRHAWQQYHRSSCSTHRHVWQQYPCQGPVSHRSSNIGPVILVTGRDTVATRASRGVPVVPPRGMCTHLAK